MRFFRSIFAILLVWIGLAFYQEDGLIDIIESGAKLEKLAGDFRFTEGPSADAKGNVYFTDQPNDRIMMWSISDELSTFMQPSGRSNGLSFDKEGYLWSCADEKNELWRIAPDKKILVIPSKYEEKVLNGPNDLWIHKNGTIYFTDPFYKRAWWDHTAKPQEKQCVYYLSAGHEKIVKIADDLVQPNGIVGTPDGKKLFVADIGANKTWSYTINKENIYLTGKGVTVFDKTGKQIGNIAVPESWTANVCFGGPDMKSLFITASKGLYRIRVKVKGTAG